MSKRKKTPETLCFWGFSVYISIGCKGLNRKSIILSGLLRFISHLLIFITVTDIVITVTVIRRGCYEG